MLKGELNYVVDFVLTNGTGREDISIRSLTTTVNRFFFTRPLQRKKIGKNDNIIVDF